MSRKYLSVLFKVGLSVAILAVLISGCGGGSADVTVKRVGPRAIEERVMVAGNLNPTAPSQVMPLVYGSVSQVFVQPGQEVAAGQPLLQLDTSNLEQSLLSAQASLESIQSMASMINGLSNSASAVGESVNALLARVDASVTSMFDFEKSLIPALPEQYRMIALQAIDSGYQAYQSQRQNMPGVSVGGGGGGYSTGAQTAAANKSIENAQKNLQNATILAPSPGTVITASTGGASLESMMATLMSSFSGMMPSGLNLSSLTGLTGGLSGMGMPSGGTLVPGSYVMPGSPIYTIVNLKQMSLTAKVDETDIAKMAAGQKATVNLEAFPGKEFKGTVTQIADTSTTNEAGATAFDMTIQMDPSDTNLKVGMTGTADVTVASKKAAVVVPVESILDKKKQKYVYIVRDGTAHLTPVTTGLVTETDIEVTSGVKTDDVVVVKGVEQLKDGQSVNISSTQ